MQTLRRRRKAEGEKSRVCATAAFFLSGVTCRFLRSEEPNLIGETIFHDQPQAKMASATKQEPTRRACNYDWDQEKFVDGLNIVSTLLGVDELMPDQKLALSKYFKDRKNLYYSAPTGHGKSLVFQAIPLLMDHMADLAFGSSTLIVICPLTSLMMDQVNSLKSTC